MDNIEFIQLGLQVLSELKPIYKEPEYSKLCSKLKIIKNYISDNPNDSIVQYFIECIIDKYVELFLNDKLVEAFNMSDELYYLKQLQIVKNLPFTTHPLYGSYLSLIFCDMDNDFYSSFEKLLKKYSPITLTDIRIQNVLNFAINNSEILNAKKDTFYSLEKEIEYYIKASHDINFEELKEFCIDGQNNIDIKQSFINKRIENIGKIYAYKKIVQSNINYCNFVSRDIKNGFGYDIYFLDNENIENLIDVKTTIKNNDDDILYLSKNEYNVMKSCVDNPNVNYIICTVSLDSALNPSFILLKLKDNMTLVDISNEEIQYKLYPYIDNNICYRKIESKILIK